ncbi:MAG: methyltransferase domain-containing protein [Rhodobacteraceae bacterium]|nr:methyltransferase domain-containing protein [Paracoccaceae bacterium]
MATPGQGRNDDRPAAPLRDQAHPAAGQSWSAQGYAHHAGFVSELGGPLVDLLDPRGDERILDLGCGDGALTARLAQSGAEVVGLEPDPSMAAAARARGLTVLERDAHDPFGEAAFDAVFSNAALHWMREPAQVLRNVQASLRPGGRFVAEQGGFGNVAAVVTALRGALAARGHPCPDPGPWDFPRPEAQSVRLEAAGFRVAEIALIPRPTPLPTGIAGWLETFAAPYLAAVPEAERPAIRADAEVLLTPLRDETGQWWADYVRLRFVAVKSD